MRWLFNILGNKHKHTWSPLKRLITTSFEECRECGALYYSSLFHDEIIEHKDRETWPGF